VLWIDTYGVISSMAFQTNVLMLQYYISFGYCNFKASHLLF